MTAFQCLAVIINYATLMISDKTDFHAFMEDVSSTIKHYRGNDMSWEIVQSLLCERAKILADRDTFDDCYPKILEAMETLRNLN